MKSQWLLLVFTFLALSAFIGGQRVRWQATNNFYDNDDFGMLAVNMMTRNCQHNTDIPAVADKLGLTKLIKLVQEAGLSSTLSVPGPFTVFGPTNHALSMIPQWLKDYISNRNNLAKLLTYHVLSGQVRSADLHDELQVKTVEGRKLRINLYPKGQKNVNVATVQCAPIDLSRVDQQASNGIVHVLSDVMIPPYGPAAMTFGACPVFQNLTSALKVAKLYDVLNGAGPFTVFAPTDHAFRKLPHGAFEKLLHNTTALTEVLTYHVVSGTYCKAGLSSGSVTTLSTKDVYVRVNPNGVAVNGVNVIQADGSVTNGVVHVIDSVLFPPGFYL